MAKLDWTKAKNSGELAGARLDTSEEIPFEAAADDAAWLADRKTNLEKAAIEHKRLLKSQRKLFKKLKAEHEIAAAKSSAKNG